MFGILFVCVYIVDTLLIVTFLPFFRLRFPYPFERVQDLQKEKLPKEKTFSHRSRKQRYAPLEYQGRNT